MRTIHVHYWWVACTIFKSLLVERFIFFRFSCDKYSNCLPGNSKKIRNCTIFSGPVCDGCEDGYYREPLVGPNGGCVECSPKCSILQVEIRSCSTDHDRECKAKGPVTFPNLSKLIYLPYETMLYPPLITIVILGSFNIMILSMVCRPRDKMFLFDIVIWTMSLTDVSVADLIRLKIRSQTCKGRMLGVTFQI